MKKVWGIVFITLALLVIGGCKKKNETSGTADTAGDTLDYPTRNITMIVPANAGTAVDTITRVVLEYLDLGKQIIITNRGGAGQTIGTAEAARSKGDGYTLLIAGDSGLIVKPTQLGLDYSVDDFRFIGLLQSPSANPYAAVASSASGYTSWEQVAADARGGKEISYTTGNAGNTAHLAMLELLKVTGVNLKFVPFNGSAEANAALQGGHVDLGILYFEPNRKNLVGGQLIPLVMFANAPVAGFEDIPITKDLGVDVQNFPTFVIMGVPKETPDDVYQYIKAKADEAFQNPDYVAGRQKMGFDKPPNLTEAELKAMVDNARDHLTRISEEAGFIQ